MDHTTPNDEQLLELTGAYVTDALDSAERDLYEAHYPTSAACDAEIADLREATTVLAEVGAVDPPPGIRAALMAEIAQTRQVAPTTPAVRDDTSTAAVTLDVGSAPGPGTLDDDLAVRRTRKRRLQILGVAAAALIAVGAVAVLRDGSPGRDVSEVYALDDTVIATLDSQTPETTAMVEVAWSPSADEVAVVATGLAPLSDDETYQLWFLVGDGVASAALFDVAEGVDAFEEVLTVDDIDGVGFGITVEPAGGSAQPTGVVLYAGTVSG